MATVDEAKKLVGGGSAAGPRGWTGKIRNVEYSRHPLIAGIF